METHAVPHLTASPVMDEGDGSEVPGGIEGGTGGLEGEGGFGQDGGEDASSGLSIEERLEAACAAFRGDPDGHFRWSLLRQEVWRVLVEVRRKVGGDAEAFATVEAVIARMRELAQEPLLPRDRREESTAALLRAAVEELRDWPLA